ncbi:MAG: ATP-binding protein [Elusimicrobia bacterium]|nr:ATP-binding protein [Elusimicrobiota bacterium]
MFPNFPQLPHSKVKPSLIFHKMFHYAATANNNFLEKILNLLETFPDLDGIKLYISSETLPNTKKIFPQKMNGKFEILQYNPISDKAKKSLSSLEKLKEKIFWAHIKQDSSNFTQTGSFCTNNTSRALDIKNSRSVEKDIPLSTKFKSIAIIPVLSGKRCAAILELASLSKNFFSAINFEIFENTAQIIGLGINNWQTHSELNERVKELSCLQKINTIAGDSSKSLSEILQEIVEFIPLAWQYTDIAAAKIIFDGSYYCSAKNFKKCKQKQEVFIIINKKTRGKVEVGYTKLMPKSDEGPFLKEEMSLLKIITRQIEFIIEQKNIEQDRLLLQEQLRHADRLATIGQLSSSIAHELNEPLTNILGYSQLILKSKSLKKTLRNDILKIEKSSMHAREVIRRVLLFSKTHSANKKEALDINTLIKENLYIFEAICEKENIKLIVKEQIKLPVINANKTQLKQVLINLIVNAIQAMSKGGTLEIKTSLKNKHILLSIKDTGIGMSEDVKKNIFKPFFTTKKSGEGTGLGLLVCNEIISSYNGFILYKSKENYGTTFEVFIPLNYDKESKDGF